jgi:Flp pilus assembly protein TadG
MTIRRHGQIVLQRRGLSAVEAAVVFPVAILLLVGGAALGIGVFRYEQVQSLAREGARFASVRGPDYVASGSGSAMASTTDVMNYFSETGLSSGLSGLSCTGVAYSSTTLPCTVAVTLQYTWSPGAHFSDATWDVTATAIVTY